MEDNPDTVFNYFDLAAAQPELRSVDLPFSGWVVEPRTVRPGNDSVLLYSPDGSLGLAIVNLVDGTAYPFASARAKYYLAGSVRDYLLFKEVEGLNTIIIPMRRSDNVLDDEGSCRRHPRHTNAGGDHRRTRRRIVTIFDGLKPVGLRVQVENPIMGGMLTETGAVVLERTGGITVIDPLTAKVKRAGVSEFGAQGAIPVADDRLYGWGGEGSAMFDAEGSGKSRAIRSPKYSMALGDPRPLVATNGGTRVSGVATRSTDASRMVPMRC